MMTVCSLTGNILTVYKIKAYNALSVDVTNSGFWPEIYFWNTPEIALPLSVCSFTVPSSILEIVGVNGDGSRTAAPNLRTSQGGRSSWMGVRFQSVCLSVSQSVCLFVCLLSSWAQRNNNNNTVFTPDECEWIFHEELDGGAVRRLRSDMENVCEVTELSCVCTERILHTENYCMKFHLELINLSATTQSHAPYRVKYVDGADSFTGN